MKNGLFPSPGSTCAPESPGTWRSFQGDSGDSGSESHYTPFPEVATSLSAETAAEGWLQNKLRPKRVCFALISAASVICLLLAARGARSAEVFRGASQPRIWNPNLGREFSTEPLAKDVIRRFDAYNMARGGKDDARTFDANVDLYMAPDLIYESVGFGTWRTPAGWAAGEEDHYGNAFPETVFTQMLFFGDERVATTTTYGVALWSGDLFGVEAPKKWVTLRITDFYKVREEAPGHGRIYYNFMMIDWVDALRQVGRRMLPPAPLEEGLVLPPAANDGVPAPISKLVQSEGRDAKAALAVAKAALEQDWAGSGGSLAHWHASMTYYGPGGIGLARNLPDYARNVVGPFRDAFANRTAVVDISGCEGNYCALLGRLHGRGSGNWLGLPTAGREISLRFAMHYRVVQGKVQEGWSIFDFPGLFAEIGLDFYALAAAGGRL